MENRAVGLCSLLVVLVYPIQVSASDLGKWGFEEAYGVDVVYDSSPNGNDCSVHGDPIRVPGQIGNSLEFYTSGDYIDCGNDTSLLPLESFSISAWVYSNGYISSGSSWNVPFSRGDPFNDVGGYGVAFTDDNQLHFVVNDTRLSSTVDVLNRWVWIVGVYDHDLGIIFVYINGVLESQMGCGGLEVDTQNFYVGRDRSGSRWFSGAVDELWLQDIALSEEEVTQLYEAIIVRGYWRFEEGTGATINDLSSYSNNCGIQGNSSRVLGRVGRAVEFSDPYDYVDCGDGIYFNVDDSFSILAWIYSNGYESSGSSWNVPIGYGDPFNDPEGYGFAFTKNNQLNFVARNVRADSGVDIKGRWVHAAGVYDSDEEELKVYIDGELRATTAFDGLVFGTKTLHFGRDRSSIRWFDGIVDEVKIYSAALDIGDVHRAYKRGSVISNWNFDEGSGNVAADSSLNTNSCALVNMNTDTCWHKGRLGNVVIFDGVDDYIECGDDETLLPTDSFSLSAWIHSTGYKNDESVVGRGDPFNDVGGYGFALNKNDQLSFIANGVSVDSGVDIKNRLVWGVGTYDSIENALSIYVDGELKGQTYFAGLGSDNQTFYIGKNFGGFIDEVQLYNVALEPRPLLLNKTFFNNDMINVGGWLPPSSAINKRTLQHSFGSTEDYVDVHMLSPGFGWVPFWDSSVYNASDHYDEWEITSGLQSSGWGDWMQEGNDVLAQFIEVCRATNQEPVVSFRLNDTHWFKDYFGTSSHPITEWFSDFCYLDEYLIDPDEPELGFDWSIAEVRNHRLAFIAEVINNYDVAGIELDFMRHPSYFDAECTTTEERLLIMTEFISDVRNMLDVSDNYLYLVARVPCFLSMYDELGLDLELMAEAGVDVFNISSYYHNIQQGTDVAEIRQLIPDKTMLYELQFFTWRDGADRIPTLDEQLYTISNLMYEYGVDAISWFNFDYISSNFNIDPPRYLLNDVNNRSMLVGRPQQWYFHAANWGSLVLPHYYAEVGYRYTYSMELALTENMDDGDALFRLMTAEECADCEWGVSINNQDLQETDFVSRPIDHPYEYAALYEEDRYRCFTVPRTSLENGLNHIEIELVSGSNQTLVYFDLAIPPDR